MTKAPSLSFAQTLANYYQNLLPKECTDAEYPCSNEICQRSIAQKHETQSGLFIRMRNPTAGNGRTYSAFKMKKVLEKDGADCKSHVICFDPMVDDNTFIVATATTTVPNRHVYYGYEVFEGIFLDNPASFTFYLAYTRNNDTLEKDVIFSVQFADEKDDRYYCLSDIMTHLPIRQDIQDPKSPSKTMSTTPLCKDDEYRKTIARSHAIRPDIFQHNLDNFWEDRPVPPGFIIMWDILETILDGHDCASERVRLEWKNDDFTNNTLIGFDFEEISGLASNMEDTFYSIELFHGIHLLNEAQEFRFYKGKNDDSDSNPNNDLTILMEVICMDGSHQYYDLSNDRP